ncbi:MAG: 4-hydroxythreonine-4-phosphate dehydrogenase PdxA [Planctomycetota bacterium]|jgi:4-hydroxythreonine-4-phosphate dehydrogenase|nr:4-hydroxythreonine-4-phosphate dehydrogenase PdxA [Planctomycetota bacterium]
MSGSDLERPLLALTVGDPAGIGPEIAAAALADRRVGAAARVVAVGPASARPQGVEVLTPAEGPAWRAAGADVGWIESDDPGGWVLGRAQAASGRAALTALRTGHDLAHAGLVDGLVTGPVSKEAMHLAGEEVEGQTELLGRWCGVDDHQMLGVAGKLRVLLLSRHLPLREALEEVSAERVHAHLHLLHGALGELGFPAPRLALAGLNPHAGEAGLVGHEEREALEPAVRAARAEGLAVSGPLPADTVFARAAAGEFDGVLALYHDQAFIPLKALGVDRTLTWIAGLPYLRVSPAHGVAFDIAGRGLARPENLVFALVQAAEWAQSRRGAAAS